MNVLVLLLNHDSRPSQDNFILSLKKNFPLENTYTYVYLYKDDLHEQLVVECDEKHKIECCRFAQMIEFLKWAKSYDYYIITRPNMRLKSKLTWQHFDGVQSRAREYWGPEIMITNTSSIGGDFSNYRHYFTFRYKKKQTHFIMDDQFFLFPHSVRVRLQYEDWRHLLPAQAGEWRLTDYMRRNGVDFKLLPIDVEFIRDARVNPSSTIKPSNLFEFFGMYIAIALLILFGVFLRYKINGHVFSSSFANNSSAIAVGG